MILAPNGQVIVDANGRRSDGPHVANLVAPNGEPITATPAAPPEHVVLDENDLKAFLNRLGVQAQRMSEHNPNLALFNEAASWIITMARQIATMQQQLEQHAPIVMDAPAEIPE